ncbi:hypothetical protein [Aquibacillus saliphilus]|uniref:hypothetical protein n=1 Tax=Aquibacillus saliphilus TaxID=1909422 RepID=UPI001CF0BC06|nr:hypothetical protein [Aquibacillus saliphilus]
MFGIFKKKQKELNVDVESHFKEVFKHVKPAKVGDVAPRGLFPTDGVYAVNGGKGNKTLAETTVEDGIITDIKRFV